MERMHNKTFVLMILLLFVPLILTSCSERIISAGEEQEIDLRIDLSGSGLDATIATEFILTVTGPSITEPIVEYLVFSNGYLTGTVIVPAGPARTFRIEAFDYYGVLIYSGQTVADVSPDTEVSLRIDLHPRVPMMKVSPMYDAKPMGTQLNMKIKVFNIENLNSIEGVLYNIGMETEFTYLARDVILDPALSDIVEFYWTSPTQDNSVHFNITHNDPGGSLTDIDGFADLVTIMINTNVDFQSDSVYFYPGIVFMTDNEGNPIEPKDVYLEDAAVKLFDSADSRVANWKMEWNIGTDPSWIEDSSPNLLHGTATGTTILEGAYGNARYFNGYSDYIEVPDDDLLDLGEGITVAFWLDISDSYPVDAKQQLPGYFPTGTIISKRSENGPVNYRISVENLSDVDESCWFLFTYGGSTTHTYRVDLPTWMLDGWNHYIFSYSFGDPSSALLVTFWDGMIAVPGAWINGDGSGAAPMTSGPLLMGKDNDAEMPRYYAGGIDEVELFDTAFDYYMIQRLYSW